MNVSPSATHESAFAAAAGFSPRDRTSALVASTSALEWIIAGYAVAFAVRLVLGDFLALLKRQAAGHGAGPA